MRRRRLEPRAVSPVGDREVVAAKSEHRRRQSPLKTLWAPFVRPFYSRLVAAWGLRLTSRCACAASFVLRSLHAELCSTRVPVWGRLHFCHNHNIVTGPKVTSPLPSPQPPLPRAPVAAPRWSRLHFHHTQSRRADQAAASHDFGLRGVFSPHLLSPRRPRPTPPASRSLPVPSGPRRREAPRGVLHERLLRSRLWCARTRLYRNVFPRRRVSRDEWPEAPPAGKLRVAVFEALQRRPLEEIAQVRKTPQQSIIRRHISRAARALSLVLPRLQRCTQRSRSLLRRWCFAARRACLAFCLPSPQTLTLRPAESPLRPSICSRCARPAPPLNAGSRLRSCAQGTRCAVPAARLHTDRPQRTPSGASSCASASTCASPASSSSASSPPCSSRASLAVRGPAPPAAVPHKGSRALLSPCYCNLPAISTPPPLPIRRSARLRRRCQRCPLRRDGRGRDVAPLRRARAGVWDGGARGPPLPRGGGPGVKRQRGAQPLGPIPSVCFSPHRPPTVKVTLLNCLLLHSHSTPALQSACRLGEFLGGVTSFCSALSLVAVVWAGSMEAFAGRLTAGAARGKGSEATLDSVLTYP